MAPFEGKQKVVASTLRPSLMAARMGEIASYDVFVWLQCCEADGGFGIEEEEHG